jgi:hypothetical protein
MNNLYLFDIEKSLTPIGSTIDSEFQSFFIDWITSKIDNKTNYLHLITSVKDPIDTVSQIGKSIWVSSKRIYQSNTIYRGRTGLNGSPLAIRNKKNKSLIIDNLKKYVEFYVCKGNIIYFGKDPEVIKKLKNEWNTLNLTHKIHQVSTYADTWDILKRKNIGEIIYKTENKEIMIKDIVSFSRNSLILNPDHRKKFDKSYNWNGLASSIKKNGILSPLIVRKITANEYKAKKNEPPIRRLKFMALKKIYGEKLQNMYTIIDGSHRLKILKILHNEEYIVKVKVIK